VSELLLRAFESAAPGPLLGLLVGALLGLSPLALPSITAVMATAGSHTVPAGPGHRSRSLLGVVPAIVAFTAGLNGVLGLAGYAFVSVTVLLARGAVAMYMVAAAMLVGGGFLLTRRVSACARLRSLPLSPGAAFVYGIGFSVGGCPGCGPVALGVGSAAAALGGPLIGLLTLVAFLLGHAAVLVAAAALGRRLAFPASATAWLRLDRVVGALLVLAGTYYLWQVLSGEVTTLLPGEPGSGVLP
jgi:cytochrome c biogenesis protein CcdA